MRRRVACILALAIGMAAVTGCWDRREVNDIAIVIAMALDKEANGDYRLSVQVPLVSSLGAQTGGGGGTSGNKSYYVDSAVGKTIREANNTIQSRMSRHIYYAHHRMIVIGEKLAREGMSDALDIVSRFPENRLTAYLVLTPGRGIDLLNAQPQFERFSGEAMRELVKMAIPVTLKEVAQMLNTPGVDAFLPVMEAVDSQPKGKSKEIQFTGIANFRKDKMVKIFDMQQMNGIRWFQRDFTPFSMVLQLNPKDKQTVYYTKGKADVRPAIEKGKIRFDIKVYATAAVIENMTNLNLNEEKNLTMIQSRLAKDIVNDVKKSVEKIQKYKTDPIGLGIVFARRYPREWRDMYRNKWNDVFPKVTFRIQSKVTIVSIGQTTKNITKEE